MKKCEQQRIGFEFLQQNHWPDALANSKFNKCFCELCYSKRCKDTIDIDNSLYIVPRGWIRFALHIDPVHARHLNIWNWSTSYHGTSIDNANSIIEHRMLLLPGDSTINGKRVEVLKGHIRGQCYFFTSPTIKYAEQYSKRYTFTSTDRKKYLIKAVMQCKQKPGTFCIQPKTISSVQKVCPYVPDDCLEWKTKHRSSIVPYGLLLRITPISADKVKQKINCPKCKVFNVFTVHDKSETINVLCSNELCLCKFGVKYCPNCSQLNVCEGGAISERKKVFVCSYETCAKRYEQLVQRRRK